MKYAFVHKWKCGKPAFLYAEWPAFGSVVESAKAMLLNGSRPKRGAACLCGSCGGQITFGLTPETPRFYLVAIEDLPPEHRALLPEEFR